MARPRTYAPPVAFRLPPDYQDKLNARAERSGLPLAVYVREVMMDLLDNGSKVKARTPRKPITAAPAPAKKNPPRTRGRKTAAA